LLQVRQKSKPELLQGFVSPVHFVAAMENIESAVPTDSRVMKKNKTFQLNHSLACANYAVYLAIHTCTFKEGRKNRKSNDEKGG